SGPIADQELQTLKKLDAGLGERIPTFEEVLDAVGPTLPIQAEIKDVAAARSLARVLTDRDLLDRVSVLSFHDAALIEIHHLLPQARTVLVAGPSAHRDTFVGRAQKVGSTLVSVELRQLNQAIVEKCGAAGIDVMAWTVNDERDLALARTLGLVGCVTDEPGMKRLVEATA
ncbi:glycerophosphodiester phosphodiesterase, partial [Streptomyces sp. NPDC004232]